MKKIVQPPKVADTTWQYNLMLGLIVFSLVTRIAIPSFSHHPINFSPIDATALICGAYLHRYFMAFITVFFSVWLGDIFINKIITGHWILFYEGFYWQYGCYFLITVLGKTLTNRINPLRIMLTGLLSAILFFIVSNFGVWYSGLLYPFSFEGLISCYLAAIPFFKNTLLSDLFFSLFLFGSIELINYFLRTRQMRNTTIS